MADARGKYPKLPVLKFANLMMSMANGTPEQIHEYNDALEQFFVRSERWMREVLAIQNRTIEDELMVANAGAVPAESVHVKLHFPDGFKLVKSSRSKELWPRSPSLPKKPGIGDTLAGLGRAFQHTPSLASAFAHSQSDYIPDSLTITKTNSYDVVWEHPKLRQNTSEPLDEMSAIFDSDASSFEIAYELRADNLRTVISGSLHVVISHPL